MCKCKKIVHVVNRHKSNLKGFIWKGLFQFQCMIIKFSHLRKVELAYYHISILANLKIIVYLQLEKCGRGVIGSRARLRIWCREAWGFESLRPHKKKTAFSYAGN